jgi:uncharacterized protein YoxC
MSPRKAFTKKTETHLEQISFRAIRWIGSVGSVVFHTVMFFLAFLLYFLGVNFNSILLTLTTVVSLEAIYLAIFIQMSVNHQNTQLKEVSEGVEDIQEDVEEIQHDIDDIQKDVDEIQEDVEEINEEDQIEETKEAVDTAMLTRIEQSLRELGNEIAEMKRRGK